MIFVKLTKQRRGHRFSLCCLFLHQIAIAYLLGTSSDRLYQTEELRQIQAQRSVYEPFWVSDHLESDKNKNKK